MRAIRRLLTLGLLVYAIGLTHILWVDTRPIYFWGYRVGFYRAYNPLYEYQFSPYPGGGG